MNEAETRAELIDSKLKESGWGEVADSKILREHNVCKITDGAIRTSGGRNKPLIADYILVYKGVKLAVIEAKSIKLAVGEGVAQAKLYAEKLPTLLQTKYQSLDDAIDVLGKEQNISSLFIEFQKHLYDKKVA